MKTLCGKYATNGVSRNFLIARDGRIVDRSLGYDNAKFERMSKVIEVELAK